MQTIVSVRFNRRLRDDVGIPPTSTTVDVGDIHDVLSGHATWLEERGFAERVSVYPSLGRGQPDPALDAFVAQLEAEMKGPHENKMIAPAETQQVAPKRKRGRPPGTKNKPKRAA